MQTHYIVNKLWYNNYRDISTVKFKSPCIIYKQ